MLSLAVFYLVAMICSARWTQALPLYPDANMETDTGAAFFFLHFMEKCSHSNKNFVENVLILTDLIQKLVSEVEDGPNTAEGEPSQANNLYPLLTQHNMGRDSWNKGTRTYKLSGKQACMV